MNDGNETFPCIQIFCKTLINTFINLQTEEGLYRELRFYNEHLNLIYVCKG